MDSGFKAAIGALVLIGGLVAYRWFCPASTFAADGIDPAWDAAVEHSQAAKKPTVVLFTANWCPACNWLHENVLASNEVQDELEQHYCFHAVDLSGASESHQALARKYGARSIPLLIRYDKDGNETDRTHRLDVQGMIGWLKEGE